MNRAGKGLKQASSWAGTVLARWGLWEWTWQSPPTLTSIQEVFSVVSLGFVTNKGFLYSLAKLACLPQLCLAVSTAGTKCSMTLN